GPPHAARQARTRTRRRLRWPARRAPPCPGSRSPPPPPSDTRARPLPPAAAAGRGGRPDPLRGEGCGPGRAPPRLTRSVNDGASLVVVLQVGKPSGQTKK